MKRFVLAAAAAAVIGSAAVASESTRVPGQQAGAAGAAGIFTAEQAAAGKTAYATACGSCHMPALGGTADAPALAGTAFLDTWRNRTTKELLDYIAGAMPPGGASLTAETYAAVVAYVLQSNGAVTGSVPFGAATAVLIRSITPPPTGRQSAPNGSGMGTRRSVPSVALTSNATPRWR